MKPKIKKSEIISVLIAYGLSPIEADRVLDKKEDFELAMEDISEKIRSEERQKTLSEVFKKIEIEIEAIKNETGLEVVGKRIVLRKLEEQLKKRLSE